MEGWHEGGPRDASFLSSPQNLAAFCRCAANAMGLAASLEEKKYIYITFSMGFSFTRGHIPHLGGWDNSLGLGGTRAVPALCPAASRHSSAITALWLLFYFLASTEQNLNT